MEKFKVIQPSITLAPYVQRYWILETDNVFDTHQRVIPNGCTELMFNRGDRMRFLCDNILQPTSYIKGQNTRYYDLAPMGKVNLISVSFTPFGAKSFFSMPINEFSEKCIDLKDISDSLLSDLSKRISDTSDDEVCIYQIEQFLLKRLNPLKDYNRERMFAAVKAINKQEQISIASLADITCVSYRQFIRIFTEHIGVTPKEYLRVVRFQRALYALQNNPLILSSDLAFICGYYDQSHLINEFKAFSGYTLSEYTTVCQPRSDYFA